MELKYIRERITELEHALDEIYALPANSPRNALREFDYVRGQIHALRSVRNLIIADLARVKLGA